MGTFMMGTPPNKNLSLHLDHSQGQIWTGSQPLSRVVVEPIQRGQAVIRCETF